MNDAIDLYLDELLTRLHGPAPVIRRTLVEAEAHLRDAADKAVEAGMDPDDAQMWAIEQFGCTQEVAASVNRHARASAGRVLAALTSQAAVMCTVGCIAIAAAAVIAKLAALWLSPGVIYGAPNGTAFPAEACTHWLAVQPTAADCAQAATLENASDTSMFYIGGALIGLVVIGLAFGVARLLRRTFSGSHSAIRLPSGVVPGIGATVFGCAGIGLLLAAVTHQTISGFFGSGLQFIDGSVALLVAVAYLVGFVRSLLRSASLSFAG